MGTDIKIANWAYGKVENVMVMVSFLDFIGP